VAFGDSRLIQHDAGLGVEAVGTGADTNGTSNATVRADSRILPIEVLPTPLHTLVMPCAVPLSRLLVLASRDPPRATMPSLGGFDAVLEGAPNAAAAPSRDVALEHEVDLLERLAGRFRVEEEYVKHHDGAKGAEYHIYPPLNIGEGRGDEERKG